jgi:hypothetical protein
MNIMKGHAMRSSIVKESSLLGYLLRGSLVLGMPLLVACSSDEGGTGDDGGTGAGATSGTGGATGKGGSSGSGTGGTTGGSSGSGTGGTTGGSSGSGTGGTTGGSSGEGATGGSTGGSDASGGTSGEGTGGTSGEGTGGTAGTDASGGTSGEGTGGTAGTSGTAGTAGTGGTGSTGDCRVWLAPDGDDANDGSEGSPVATLAKAYDLMCPVPPTGTANGAECLGAVPRTICAESGTYAMTERLEFKKTRMGTADKRLTLMAAPGAATRPIFDFSGQERLECGANPDNIGGFTVNAHYVTIKDVVVTGANDNCILVQGTEGLIENVLTYECADTGIQISSGGEYEGSGTNNTVLNCDSHSNYDVQCDGENADGFAIKEGTGEGNEFIGCRAWNNTDDGFDFYGWTSTVRLENSWAFDQCASTEDDGSDCNGFKLGGDGISATHTLVDLIAVGNSRGTGNGFTENSNPASMTCTGTCASWDNNVDVDSIGGVSTTAIDGANVTNMKADAARNADGSLKYISAL